MSDPYQVAGAIRRSLYAIRENYADALDPGRVSDDSDRRPGSASGEPVNLHAVDVRSAHHAGPRLLVPVHP